MLPQTLQLGMLHLECFIPSRTPNGQALRRILKRVQVKGELKRKEKLIMDGYLEIFSYFLAHFLDYKDTLSLSMRQLIRV